MKNEVKKYDKIILLGENCELGYQYVKNFGYLESNLFNWCFVFNKEALLEAIKNPNIVTSAKIENVTSCAMFDDYVSGCRFHSRYLPDELLKNNMPDLEKYEEEKQNLIAKNKYLSKKLLKTYKTDSKKLFIYKAQFIDNENINSYKEFLNNLNNILNDITINFDILFIVKSDFYEIFKNDFKEKENIYIRKVKNFTLVDKAFDKRVSDNYSWNKIFREFCPIEIKKKIKVYKFEKEQIKYNFFEKIFSIKKSAGKKRKILTIFGIKIKFKIRSKK